MYSMDIHWKISNLFREREDISLARILLLPPPFSSLAEKKQYRQCEELSCFLNRPPRRPMSCLQREAKYLGS
jgi:hypothetical protein